MRASAQHKAPGIDGFGLEFYTANWQTIHPDFLEVLNQMFLHKKNYASLKTCNLSLPPEIKRGPNT
jgi:hypothetical protein